MKYQLFSYQAQDSAKTGILVSDRWFDLDGAALHADHQDLVMCRVDDYLEHWSDSHGRLGTLAGAIAADITRFAQFQLDPSRVKLLAPLERPGVIYGAGANYRDHVEAMGRAFNMKLVLDPKAEGIDPWHFIKAGRGTLAGHRQAISLPSHTTKLDWEAELAVIIGRRAKDVPVDNALDIVAGYACANDISARDNLVRQAVDATSPFRFDWIGHKCFTGSCPLGPVFTPAAFVESPEDLDIKLWVNGVIKQDSNTNNHLYGVAEQIAYLSTRLELFPGDIILTGTPAGVGMETGTFLQRGDVMKVWIEGLGELENTIV